MTLTHWLFWLFDVLCKASKQGCLAMGYRDLPFHRFLWCFLLFCSPFHRWRTYAEKRKQKNREFSGFLLVILENPKSSTAHWPDSARKSHQCKEEPPMQSAAVYARDTDVFHWWCSSRQCGTSWIHLWPGGDVHHNPKPSTTEHKIREGRG